MLAPDHYSARTREGLAEQSVEGGKGGERKRVGGMGMGGGGDDGE